jgi:hypothetical protein
VKETIETLCGNDEITNRTLEVFKTTKKTIEACAGRDEVAMQVTHEWHMQGLLQLKEKGVEIRIVTQVTKENLEYCKIYSKVVELRHLDGIQSSFGISDGEWLLDHVVSLDEFPLSHAILTNVRKVVDAKRKLFEIVWKQSLPAQELFSKLEEIKTPEVNTQLDPTECRQILFSLITNSKYHVDMIIPTGDCINPLVTNGLSNYLNTALKQGVKVRILLPKDERSLQFNNNIKNSNLQIKQLDDIRAKKIMLMVDSLHSLVMEIKESKQHTLKSLVKSAVYSTSNVGLMTFTALFEKMWI